MTSQAPTQGRARHQVSQPYAFAPSSFPTRPGSPILSSSRSEGSLIADDRALLWTSEELPKRRQLISIDMLPDDALLAIFDHYIYNAPFKGRQNAWQSLVHVCRRWRSVVFESPRHLNLRLVCTDGTPARGRLDVWPALPLIILCDGGEYPIRSMDNVIAVLERSDRVWHIDIVNVRSSDMELFLATMQQRFPELIYLHLWPDDGTIVVPDSFLGGSAPSLQYLGLYGIAFLGLPKLLLSAAHLDTLHLEDIPHSGYFSPDAMATALSTMTSLSYLWLGFQSPRSCPDRASRRPPPTTRSVLPIFTTFRFKGVSEYLEDLVAYIDAPRLDVLGITFFNDTAFDTPQLIYFISRTPRLKPLVKARITIQNRGARVIFSSHTSLRGCQLEILCKGLDWQVSSLEQVCTSCLPPLSMLEDLYIHEDLRSQLDRKDIIDNGLWLELLQPFNAVKNLYLSEKFASRIVPALQELVEGRMTEVLPTLQNIFLGGLKSSGLVQKGVE